MKFLSLDKVNMICYQINTIITCDSTDSICYKTSISCYNTDSIADNTNSISDNTSSIRDKINSISNKTRLRCHYKSSRCNKTKLPDGSLYLAILHDSSLERFHCHGVGLEAFGCRTRWPSSTIHSAAPNGRHRHRSPAADGRCFYLHNG